MARFQLVLPMMIIGTIGLLVDGLPIPSFTVALCRVVLASASIGIYLLVTRQKISFSGMKKSFWLLIFSGGCIGMNFTFLLEAYRYIPYGIATLCDYFAPVVVMILTPIFFHERFTAKQVICFVMATVGLILMVGIGGIGGGLSVYGVLIGLCGMLFYVPVMMINRAIKEVNGIQRTFLQFVVASFVLLVVSPLAGEVSFAGMQAWDWVKLVVVGTVHTGLSYCMYFSALPKLSGQQGAILSYADPLTAMAVSLFIMGDAIEPIQIIGGGILLAFTLGNELDFPKRKR